MINSMTGYGRSETEVGGRTLTVEIKAVNHRFLNFFCKLPPDLQRFEAEIQALVKAHLQRGQVNVFASWGGGAADPGAVVFNVDAAQQAAQVLRQAAAACGVPAQVTLGHILSIPAVTAQTPARLEPEALWRACGPVFGAALDELDALRAREGRDLDADIRSHLDAVAAVVDDIDACRDEVVREHRERLLKRLEELLPELPAEAVEERVALEVAVFADRCDVSEEVVRLRSHLDKFAELLDGAGVLGRKLEFLLQEMNREVNTIGSKASNADISRRVVDIKAALEKIREQIQNVE